MGEFFFKSREYEFEPNSLSRHDVFPKTLTSLMQEKEDLLWNTKKVDYYKARSKLTEEDLEPLFTGVYPEIFH